MPAPDSWSEIRFTTLSGVTRIDALLCGLQWASGDVSYSFPKAGATWSNDPETGYGSDESQAEPWLAGYQGLLPEDQAATRFALDAWGAVADLRFTEVPETATEVGNLRLAYVSGVIAGDAQAYAYYPFEAAYAGDVWFNIDGSSFVNPWDPGSYEYLTVLHELGHALGLKHPFEQEGLSSAVLPDALDTRSFTVMSYAGAPGEPGSGFSYEPTTPMLLDIAAMQLLYGANTGWHAGDTIYRYESGALYHQTIHDAGGKDTIVLAGSAPGRIDLRAGVYGSRVAAPVLIEHASGDPGPRVDNLWIAFGTLIENATGGSGADRITGNRAANILNGRAGEDVLAGELGGDALYGGGGNDRLLGGAGSDLLAGGAGRDLLKGGGGADRFLFDTLPESVDRLPDFAPGVDRLLLDRAIFAALPAGPLDPARLQIGEGVTHALDGDDRLLYDSATGALYYDPDGTGAQAAMHIATLGDDVPPLLSAADVMVIA